MFYPQLAPTGVSSQLGRPRPFNPDAAQALATAPRRRIEGEVRFDTGSRALYATDGSNYRQVPIGVVIPKSIEDVMTTVAVCREHQAPVLPRGCGTSLAGQCCNIAVVMDFSKYLNRILELDPVQQSAVVDPGVPSPPKRTLLVLGYPDDYPKDAVTRNGGAGRFVGSRAT